MSQPRTYGIYNRVRASPDMLENLTCKTVKENPAHCLRCTQTSATSGQEGEGSAEHAVLSCPDVSTVHVLLDSLYFRLTYRNVQNIMCCDANEIICRSLFVLQSTLLQSQSAIE